MRRGQRRRVDDHVEPPRKADQSWKPLRATATREEAEIQLGKADLARTFGGEAQVACKGELDTAPEAGPRDGGDEDERRVLHLAKRVGRETPGHDAAHGPAGRARDYDG